MLLLQTAKYELRYKLGSDCRKFQYHIIVVPEHDLNLCCL